MSSRSSSRPPKCTSHLGIGLVERSSIFQARDDRSVAIRAQFPSGRSKLVGDEHRPGWGGAGSLQFLDLFQRCSNQGKDKDGQEAEANDFAFNETLDIVSQPRFSTSFAGSYIIFQQQGDFHQR